MFTTRARQVPFFILNFLLSAIPLQLFWRRKAGNKHGLLLLCVTAYSTIVTTTTESRRGVWVRNEIFIQGLGSQQHEKPIHRQDTQCPDAVVDEVNVTLTAFMRQQNAVTRSSDRSFSTFLRLLSKAGLAERLDDETEDVTLFVVTDLSLNASAGDISNEFGIRYRMPGDEIDTNRLFGLLGRRFPRLFANPQAVLGALMRHQVIGSILNQCDLSATTSWTTWAEQPVNISGYRLNAPGRDPASFLEPPQIALQFLPTRATNGIIHVVDRLIIPDLSAFAAASASPSRFATPSVDGNDTSAPSTPPQRSSPAASQSPLPSNTDTIIRSSANPSPSDPPPAADESPPADDSDSGRVCFPASAHAHTAHGRVPMPAVHVGTAVQDGVEASTHTSRVLLLTHREEARVSGRVHAFTELRTVSFRVRLSASHLLAVNGRLAQAAHARVGDWLRTVNGSQRIVEKRTVRDRGLYNPHTASGWIVVDGVLVSCYTAAVRPTAAHALLAPVRAAFVVQSRGVTAAMRVVSDFVESYRSGAFSSLLPMI